MRQAMDHLEAISEHEMVALFLKTEIKMVGRHGPRILELLEQDGRERRIIEEPDIRSPAENAYRTRLLGDYRGYQRQEGIFKFVPREVAWHRYAFSRDDLARVRYIDYDYWTELSGGSRRAIDAARNIRAGIVVFGQSTEWGMGLAREVKRGAVFPEMIMVGSEVTSDLTVLEGHARLTAYCLALEHVPEPLTAIVGFFPGAERV